MHAAEKESNCKYKWLYKICDVLGWMCFFAWSISVYPQIYLNYKRKSVIGLSFDHSIYNCTGFSFDTIYNVSYYCIFINHKNNPIAINDIALAANVLLLSSIIIFQIIIYDRGIQKPSLFAIIFVSILAIIAIYNS